MNPTIYLTQFSVTRPTFCGVGARYGIVALPRRWEQADGTVTILQAQRGHEVDLLRSALNARRKAYGSSTPEMEAYKAALETRWTEQQARGLLAPGRLSAVRWRDEATLHPLQGGETLCCSCGLAEAEAGRCHRTWAAPFLVRAGWRVVLDGREQTNTEEVNLG